MPATKLLNYTTEVPAAKTIGEIQALLAAHGASRIVIAYDKDGQTTSLAFEIETRFGPRAFRMPVDTDAVYRVLFRQHRAGSIPLERASRVAWRIAFRWLQAQMALLDTEMVKLEEVMLPYMLADGSSKTLYKVLEEGGFTASALPQGHIRVEQDSREPAPG